MPFFTGPTLFRRCLCAGLCFSIGARHYFGFDVTFVVTDSNCSFVVQTSRFYLIYNHMSQCTAHTCCFLQQRWCCVRSPPKDSRRRRPGTLGRWTGRQSPGGIAALLNHVLVTFVMQKPAPATAPQVAFLAKVYARVAAAHAIARLSPTFRGPAMSFDTLREESDDNSVCNCSSEINHLIGILRDAFGGMDLAGAEWHVTVQCCDAHGRLLCSGSSSFYAIWSVLHHEPRMLPPCFTLSRVAGIFALPSPAFHFMQTRRLSP
jgi:hypothetical protein